MNNKLENEENINPAISNTKDFISELSAEEFQKSLFKWFEERGVVSELRTHLRRHMIEILKDTNLGRTVSQAQNVPLSPRTQVLNLLIAEFLMKNKCYYSLSVFSTEVPFINFLPTYSSLTKNKTVNFSDMLTKDSSFTELNFWDILQKLGFTRDHIYSVKLQELYYKNPNDSLLFCIIQLLSNICKNKNKQLLNDLPDDISSHLNSNAVSWFKDIYNLLINYDIPHETFLQLYECFKNVFDKEQIKIRAEETTNFNTFHEQIQKDLRTKEADISNMINEIENTFFKEKQKILEDISNERSEMENIRKALIHQQQEYEDKLVTLNRKEEILKEHEIEVMEQKQVLKNQNKVMEELYDSVLEENAKVYNQEKLNHKNNEQQTTVLQAKLQLDYEHLRKEIQETRETVQQFSQLPDDKNSTKTNPSEIVFEEKLLKGILDRVQEENSQLKQLNIEQQRRLDELTLRNSLLMSDLENSQTTINILSRNRARTIPNSRVPPVPPPMPRSQPATSQYLNGAGENNGFLAQPRIAPMQRNLIHTPSPRDSRRKAPKKLVVHSDSSEESSSPTEEILQEARLRLRRLEQETEQADRNYREFRQRHSQSIRENLHIITQPVMSTFDVARNNDTHQNETTRNYNLSLQYQLNANTKLTSIEKGTKKLNVKEKYDIENMPSTSKGLTYYRSQMEQINDGYRSSGASSGALPPLHNLSISSVEFSSDNPEASDQGKNTKTK